MRMRTLVASALAAVVVLGAAPVSAKAGKGELFYDGGIVRTVVNPAAMPHGGSDPLFVVANGAEGQLAVAGLAPGDRGYRGGAWAVHEVAFEEGVTPYLLTSRAEVEAAEAAGDVTVTRLPDSDFRCPVLP